MPGSEPSVLLRPEARHLADYDAALARGWSLNNLRPEAAEEERARIEQSPEGLLAGFEDVQGAGPPVVLPDGSTVARLPSIRRFIWDDGFAGVISLRWTRDGGPLPPTCLGHVGYAVVPWRRREGLATRALVEICALAPGYGLRVVEVTTDPQNLASQGVIVKAGGVLVRAFQADSRLGLGEHLLYEIACGGALGRGRIWPRGAGRQG